MATGIRRALSELEGRRRVARLHRSVLEPSKFPTEGFVVGVADDLVLVHVVDHAVVLDGFRALRLADVTAVDAGFESVTFVEAALRLRGERPRRPAAIRLTTIRALIESAGARFPLITLHQEREDPDVCWIGRVTGVDDLRVTIDFLTPSARWDGRESYAIRTITRVEFGGRYEEALALVAEQRGARTRRMQPRRHPH